MNALLPALIVAALAELGSRTQLLAMLLGDRYRRPGAVLTGIALASLAVMGLGAAAGFAIAQFIEHVAIQLMTGLALVAGGTGCLFKAKPPESIEGWTIGPFASSAGAFFILALANETQFITATIAAGSAQPILTAVGAATGIVIADAPAVMLGGRWRDVAPLGVIRPIAGLLLIAAGIVLAIRALGLV